MAESVEQVRGLPGEPGHALGDEPGRRVPGARRVIGDGLESVVVEGPLERVPHLDVPAQAHDEEQGPPLASDRHPHEVAVDQYEREEPAGQGGRRHVTGGRSDRERARSAGGGGGAAWPVPAARRPNARPAIAASGPTSCRRWWSRPSATRGDPAAAAPPGSCTSTGGP